MQTKDGSLADAATLRLVVESAPSALIMVDISGAITLVNPHTEELFGYARAELLGKPIEMLIPERYRGGHSGLRDGFFRQPSKRAMGAGRDLYGLRKDGTEVPVEIGLTPIQMQVGTCVLASVVDITERRRLERERRESELRYMELVDQAADAIMVRRDNGEIVFVNDAACSLLGYSRTEFMHMSIRDISELDSLEQVRAMKPLETRYFERRLRHKAGHWVPVETSAHRLKNGDIQNIFHDISERLRSQEALSALPKQLLDAQEMERRRIARELHDELGQTLTASQIKVRAMEKRLKGNPEANNAAEVLSMLATMLQQVRQLSLDLRPAVLDDLGLAPAIRWFVRERVIQSDLEVKLDMPLGLSRFPTRVETAVFRTFQSAVTNAVRHAEARTIQVSLRFEAPRLTLEIRDDGKGFDLEAAQSQARQGRSLGVLGMAEWMGLCGGDLVIDSAVGRGTVVRAVISISEETGDTGDGSRGG
jgi:PAS domain S-box-containing protein